MRARRKRNTPVCDLVDGEDEAALRMVDARAANDGLVAESGVHCVLPATAVFDERLCRPIHRGPDRTTGPARVAVSHACEKN